jgi:hypothetical protein
MSGALTACSEAYERRNQLIHAEWDPSSEADVFVTSRSRRRTFKNLVGRWTLDDIHAVDDSLRDAGAMLVDALGAAKGLDGDIAWQLSREESDGSPDEQHDA